VTEQLSGKMKFSPANRVTEGEGNWINQRKPLDKKKQRLKSVIE